MSNWSGHSRVGGRAARWRVPCEAVCGRRRDCAEGGRQRASARQCAAGGAARARPWHLSRRIMFHRTRHAPPCRAPPVGAPLVRSRHIHAVATVDLCLWMVDGYGCWMPCGPLPARESSRFEESGSGTGFKTRSMLAGSRGGVGVGASPRQRHACIADDVACTAIWP